MLLWTSATSYSSSLYYLQSMTLSNLSLPMRHNPSLYNPSSIPHPQLLYPLHQHTPIIRTQTYSHISQYQKPSTTSPPTPTNRLKTPSSNLRRWPGTAATVTGTMQRERGGALDATTIGVDTAKIGILENCLVGSVRHLVEARERILARALRTVGAWKGWEACS